MTPLIALGGWGCMLLLMLVNRLYPKGTFDEMRADRDAERQGRLNERERAEAAEKRADIAVESARLTAEMVAAFKKSLEP